MRRVAVIALLAIAASACTLDVDIRVALDANGAGSVKVDIITDDEFQSLYRLTGRDFEDLIATRGSEIGLAFTVTPGDPIRYTAETGRLQTEALVGILEGLAPGIGEVRITPKPESLELDGNLEPLTGIDDVAPYFTDSDPAQFAGDANVKVSMTMAGEIDASTATRVEGGNLTWVLPFSDSGTRLFARSILEEESGEFPWVLAILAITLVLAFGFLMAIRSGLAYTGETARPTPPGTPKPASDDQPAETDEPEEPVATEGEKPEDQPVAPDSTPPEDQPVAPPSDT